MEVSLTAGGEVSLLRALDFIRQKNDFVQREELPGNHYIREGANVSFFFFARNANGRRGWAAAVALTRVAQLGNRANFATTTTKMKKKKKRSGRTLACSRISLYILLLQPTRVAACLVAVPGSTFLRHSRLSRSSPLPLVSLLWIFFLIFPPTYHCHDGPQTNA